MLEKKKRARPAYAVALGSISLILVVGMLVWMKVQGDIEGNVWKALVVVLALWWVIGACVLTFGSIFFSNFPAHADGERRGLDRTGGRRRHAPKSC